MIIANFCLWLNTENANHHRSWRILPRGLLLLASFHCVNLCAKAETARVAANLQTSPLQFSNDEPLSRLISSVPGGSIISKILQDYREVLGLAAYGNGNVGLQNKGLSQNLEQEFRTNLSFALSAERFYSKIRTIDARYEALKAGSIVPPLGHRASLADSAGSQGRNHLYPGWLWDLATQEAKGDRNLAMRLIGLCGHDDTLQGNFNVSGSHGEDALTKLVAIRAASLADRQSVLKAAREQLASERSLNRRNLIRSEIDSAISLSEISLAALLRSEPHEAARNSLLCPDQTSNFYVPKSLGADTDLDQDLKARLVWHQARQDLVKGDRRGESVPAKAYHVIGSAYVSCEMIRRGHSPLLVKNMAPLIAWAYRSQRLAEASQNLEVAQGDETGAQGFHYQDLTEEQWQRMFHDDQQSFKSRMEVYRANIGAKLGFLRRQLQSARDDNGKMLKNFLGEEDAALAQERYERAPSVYPFYPPIDFGEYLAKVRKQNKHESATFIADQNVNYERYKMNVIFANQAWKDENSQTESASADPYDLAPIVPPNSKIIGETLEQPRAYINFVEFKKHSIYTWATNRIFREGALELPTKRDAIFLLRQMTVNGTYRLGNVQLSIPLNTLTLPLPGRVKELGSFPPNGWSTERYQRAKQKLDSWLIDFEWTIAQHSAGADFASKNCKPDSKLARRDRSEPSAGTEVKMESQSAK